MDVLKKVLNVFGIIFGVIFSFALIGALVVAPVLSGACEFVQTDNLKKIVSEMDMKAIMMDSMVGSSAEDAELMNVLFEDGLMDEIMDLYIEDLFTELDGGTVAKKLTGESVTVIMENHMDTFVELTKSQLDEQTLQLVSDEEIADMLRESLGETAQEMVDSFPTIYDMGLDEETLNTIGVLRDGLVGTVGIVLVAILAVIVFICQFPRFKSFMWLGVDFIIGGGLTLVLATSLELILKAALASIPLGTAIMNPVVETFAAAMKKGALVELGLAVLFVVIFIVGRVILKKKAALQVTQ